MEQYPTLQLWVRYGDRIAAAVAVAIVLAGLWGTILYGSWICVAGAGVVAALGYLLIRGYAELVRLVTDMLLPK